MLAPEVTNILKQAMIAAVEREGGDYGENCYFLEVDVQNIIRAAAREELSVKRDDILKWANSLRERHADPEHRAIFLNTEYTDDKRDNVKNCLIVCFCNAVIPETGLVINKARCNGVYNISAQLAVRNTVTNETRIFIEKPDAVRNSVLYKTLARELRATQIQVFSFPRNDPNPSVYARRSVEEFARRPGMQVVRLGAFKTPYHAAPAAPPPGPKKPEGAVADSSDVVLTAAVGNLSSAVATHAKVDVAHAEATEENAETIAKLRAENAHLRHVTHQLRGQMGAAVRVENTETRRENKRLKLDVEELKKREQQMYMREQQAYQREQQLMGMIPQPPQAR